MANDPKKDQEKKAAALASLRYIEDGFVVGLGTGSTAAQRLPPLAEKVKAGLKICGIPTSVHTKEMAAQLGIPLTTLDECPQIDVTIDGADEVDPQLNLIKGGGGALLREKITASASRRLIIIADSSKRLPFLGNFPLPVEVIPFAESLLIRRIEALGAAVKLRTDATGKPFVTDEHHHILDCHFGKIADPPALARTLEAMPGVVEHGLFIGMAWRAIFGGPDGVQELTRSGN
jgi:ribose 5-phosphate isomerase A